MYVDTSSNKYNNVSLYCFVAACGATLVAYLILTAKVEIVAEPSSTNNKLQDSSTSTTAIDTTSIILSTKLITVSKWGFSKSSLNTIESACFILLLIFVLTYIIVSWTPVLSQLATEFYNQIWNSLINHESYQEKQPELITDLSEHLSNRVDTCIGEPQDALVKRDSFLLKLEAVKLFFCEADSIFRSGFYVKDARLFEGKFNLNPDTDPFANPITGNGVEMMIFYMDWIIEHRDDISAENIIEYFDDERELLSVSQGLKHKVDAVLPRSGFFTPLFGGSSGHSPASSSEYVTASGGGGSCEPMESVLSDGLAVESEGSFKSSSVHISVLEK